MIIKNEFTKQIHSVTERRGLAIAFCKLSRHNVFPVLFTSLHGKIRVQREDRDRMSFPCKSLTSLYLYFFFFMPIGTRLQISC